MLVIILAAAVTLQLAAAALAVTRPNPVIELRKAMSRRFYGENTIRWAALSPIVCRRLAAKPGQQFRYLCTFKNFAEEGTARVELGTPPAWKTTVTITRLVCLKEPDRKGCP